MIDGKKVLAIIPARAGSKRVINKNIRVLSGLPLLGWTLKDLHKSKYIDHSFVSTDSSEIQTIAKGFGVDAEPLRPKGLASDLSKSIDVVLDVINVQKKGFDIVVLLQPTSPLRTIEDIDKALEFFIEKSAFSVTSVCPTETHPSWMTSLSHDQNLSSLINGLQSARSQDLETYYRLNGAIYIANVDMVNQHKSLFSPTRAYAYIMDKISSIDIDTEDDIALAEALLSLKRK